jgi:hypothetical protein
MTRLRSTFLTIALLGAFVHEHSAAEGRLHIERIPAFNASNRQPTIWIDDGQPIDLHLSQSLDIQVVPGPHVLTIATRVPADPTQFMQRRKEQFHVNDGETINVEVQWVANLFMGHHEVKIVHFRGQPPETMARAAQAPVSQTGMPTFQPYRNGISGKSRFVFPNKDIYEGDFVDGQIQGEGVYLFPNGDRYEGHVDRGQLSGRGTYIGASGDRFVGYFVNRMRNGKGVLNFASGNRYEGDFLNNQITGRGTFTTTKGARYDGDVLNGQFHGQGVLILENGRRLAGLFNGGKFVTNEQAVTSSGDQKTNESDFNFLGEMLGAFAKGRYGDGTTPQTPSFNPQSELWAPTRSLDCEARSSGLSVGNDKIYNLKCR